MPIPPDSVANSNHSVRVTDDERAAFGAFLQRARSASGLSLHQIAEQTKVCQRYLAALERGHVEVLPEGLYRRSILRAYATAVNLDANLAVERLTATFGPKEHEQECEPLTPSPSRPSWRTRPQWITAASIAVAMALAAIAATAFVPWDSAPEPQRLATPNIAPPLQAESRPTPSVAAGAPNEIAPPVVPVATSGSIPVESVPPPITPAAATGQLTVISSPAGARVTVDGIGWGITPVTVAYLSPGVKVVRVTKDGYESIERQISLDGSNGAAEVQLELVPQN